MPTLYILIIMALCMYIFYRIKAWKTKLPMKKQWTGTKGQIALGSLMFLFGLNRLFLNLNSLIVIVAIVFILLGAFYIIYAIRAYRYYLPKAIEESMNQKA